VLVFVVLAMQSVVMYMLSISLEYQKDNITAFINNGVNFVYQTHVNHTTYIASKIDATIDLIRKVGEEAHEKDQSQSKTQSSFAFNLFIQEPYRLKLKPTDIKRNKYFISNTIFHSSLFDYEQPHPPQV
jgi:hypothetical protein